MLTTIGDVAIHDGEPPDGNPYKGTGITGAKRERLLDAFRDGNDVGNATFWHAPGHGGARRIDNPDEILYPGRERSTDGWSDVQEACRVADIAAGIEPCLFPFWGGSKTANLQATLAEILEKKNPKDSFFAEAIRDLRLELRYRGAGVSQ